MAAVAVASTAAGIAANNKTRREARQASILQKYAAEVQMQQQIDALETQKAYTKQQQALQESVIRQQDAQAKQQLLEQGVAQQAQLANATYQNQAQVLAAQQSVAQQRQQLDKQAFAVNERSRAQKAQGYSQSEQTSQAMQSRLAQVEQALLAGDQAKAGRIAMSAASGQDGSRTSGIMSNDTAALVGSLLEKANAGRLEQDDLQQLQYNEELANLIHQAGASEAFFGNARLDNQERTNQITGDMNAANIANNQQLTERGLNYGLETLDATGKLKAQQRVIDNSVSDMNYRNQATAIKVGGSAAQNQANSVIRSNGGNGIISALQLGTTIMNAAAPFMNRTPSPAQADMTMPASMFRSPVESSDTTMPASMFRSPVAQPSLEEVVYTAPKAYPPDYNDYRRVYSRG
jgi:hypothetical protein